MKRTLTICLTVVLVFGMMACMTACGGGDGPEGRYDLVDIEAAGQKMTADDLKSMAALGGKDPDDIEIFIEFDKDGTGRISSAGNDTDFTWEKDHITISGQDAELKLSGKTVTITEEEAGVTSVMTFKK